MGRHVDGVAPRRRCRRTPSRCIPFGRRGSCDGGDSGCGDVGSSLWSQRNPEQVAPPHHLGIYPDTCAHIFAHPFAHALAHAHFYAPIAHAYPVANAHPIANAHPTAHAHSIAHAHPCAHAHAHARAVQRDVV
mmetsp:Transcript_20446/g.48750  ORF Transcript_20446/g.48750 Transcript_20446/m.48750 type:complete len:133 (-) Transcript_20446:706-1104(-)